MLHPKEKQSTCAICGFDAAFPKIINLQHWQCLCNKGSILALWLWQRCLIDAASQRKTINLCHLWLPLMPHLKKLWHWWQCFCNWGGILAPWLWWQCLIDATSPQKQSTCGIAGPWHYIQKQFALLLAVFLWQGQHFGSSGIDAIATINAMSCKKAINLQY